MPYTCKLHPFKEESKIRTDDAIFTTSKSSTVSANKLKFTALETKRNKREMLVIKYFEPKY